MGMQFVRKFVVLSYLCHFESRSRPHKTSMKMQFVGIYHHTKFDPNQFIDI